MTDEILNLAGVTHRFGGVAAVNDCTWTLPVGGLTAVIGPNGAGKSTLLDVVSGLLPLQQGKLRFNGEEVSGKSAFRLAQRGCMRTFQIPRCFNRLTVLENMLVSPLDQPGEKLVNALFRPRLGRNAQRKDLEEAKSLIAEFGLYHLRDDWASDLSGGQKRLLELARAMMGKPKLLMLDEPMAGVNPVLIQTISQHLKQIHASGVTVLLIEHNLRVVEELCDVVTVMVQGEMIATDSMLALRRNPDVVSAYLGRQVVENA